MNPAAEVKPWFSAFRTEGAAEGRLKWEGDSVASTFLLPQTRKRHIQ